MLWLCRMMKGLDVLEFVYGAGEASATTSKGPSRQAKGTSTQSGTVRKLQRPKLRRSWVWKGWQNELGRWLQRDDSGTKLFCKVCNITWDMKKVQKDSLAKHAQSFKHRQAIGGLPGSTKSENATFLWLAPSSQEFYDCLTRRLKGDSFKSSESGFKREVKMTWCIGQVLIDRERKKLEQTKCIGLSQDVQGSTLSVRFSHVHGPDLELSQCLLGYQRSKTGSEGVAAATKKVIQNFFTKRRKPPIGWNGKQDVFLRGAMTKFCNKTVPRPMFQHNCFLNSVTWTLSKLKWHEMTFEDVVMGHYFLLFVDFRKSCAQMQQLMSWRLVGSSVELIGMISHSCRDFLCESGTDVMQQHGVSTGSMFILFTSKF